MARDLGRINAFSDGVMAVAITLLVLNLDVPPKGAAEELGEQLVDLLPSVGTYLLSFALVGRFWVIHHNLFGTLRSFDGTVIALNLVFLALIAIVPFSTDLFDEYSDDALAVAVFGFVMGLAALVHWSMTSYSLRRGFVHEAHREATRPFGSAASLAFTAIFMLSVPAAFINVNVAQAMWLATIVLRYPLRRLTGRSSSA
jgi:uncharacterized membrane protein